jgi:signal transduction histidine kinase
MAIVTSPEFMALCRAQLRLLSEGLGASLSVVYLTEELADGSESKLTPIVVYPETSTVWNSVMTQINSPLFSLPQNRSLKSLGESSNRSKSRPRNRSKSSATDYQTQNSHNNIPRRQILLPLISEGTILGVLLTTREEPPWNPAEQSEIQHIAQTIAIAGTLDRRQQWLAMELQQQQQRQAIQQDLVRNLLHQLRSPLTAIRTFGKLLIRRFQLEDPNQKAFGGIVRESDRLQELLQHLERAMAMTEVQIEETSTVDRSILQLPPSNNANLLLPAEDTRQLSACHLSDILAPLINTAGAIAQDRELQLKVSIPDLLPPILGNAAALREIISIPIDNALKYTLAGGTVEIKVTEFADLQPPQLAIAIRDNGLGIPAADLPRLFERGYRGSQADGDIPGTGLGLAIAKELITQMQGRIEVASPPVGCDRGTEFLVWLNVAKS